MFLRKVYDAHYIIKKSMALYEAGSPEWQLEKNKIQLLKTIIQFIKTDSVKQAPARDKLDALMTTHFDYKRVACMFHTTENSIKSSISYLSKSIESKVGVDTLELILAGDLDTARSNFLACSKTYSLDDFIVGNMKGEIPFRIPKELEFTTCMDELVFLKAISVAEFLKLNLEKLILLRYILESTDKRYIHEKSMLIDYILGKSSLEELLLAVKDRGLGE